MREFDKRSRHFFLGDHFVNSYNLSVDSVWLLLGENWSWSLLALKGLSRPRANGHNIVGCYMLCPFAHAVVCCCMLLGRNWSNIWAIDSQHFNKFNIIIAHFMYTYGWQSLMGCILPVVHCRSQHCLVTFVGHKSKIEPKGPLSCWNLT